MRSSVLSRSVIAAVSLAIGSAALVAAPATAATTNGITREEVLAATNEARALFTTKGVVSTPAVTALAAKGCGVPASDVQQTYPSPVREPDSVDGLVVDATLRGVPSESDPDGAQSRTCTFTAIAALGAKTTLGGEAIVGTVSFRGGPTATSSQAYGLSGEVFASPALVSDDSYNISFLAASGIATGEPSAAVLTKVKKADKKSTADKRAAKKAYTKRLKGIKKAYTKSLKRAGSNRSKKSTARATYVTRRASAKQAYRYAVADYKFVNTRSKRADGVRFSVNASSYLGIL